MSLVLKKFFRIRQKKKLQTLESFFFALFLSVSVEKIIECCKSVTQDLKRSHLMKQALIRNVKGIKRKGFRSQQHPALEGSDC